MKVLSVLAVALACLTLSACGGCDGAASGSGSYGRCSIFSTSL